MIFSSLLFIYVFLPILLILYYGVCRNNNKLGNIVLLLASLFFYAWGEPKFVIVMMISIIINYLLARLIDKIENEKNRKIILITDIVINIGILFVFKYLNFSINVIDSLLGEVIPHTSIALPIGISFFTFQAMAYVIDVYRKTVNVQKNILYVALYISFFPQLIAGPIVRYSTIENQILNRQITWNDFCLGIKRFVIGFCKKIILANNIALIADLAFDLVQNGSLSTAMAWLGAIAYSLQIFFDFSAYSDMAIGLGMMFGFHFTENFNYPYLSKSISDFWRRWHISLGSWFKDYVYIPLGGSRGSKTLLVRNLFVVWILTGIWHGANWTFIIWGVMYFVFITIEKIFHIPQKCKLSVQFCYRIITLLVICFGWVIFRSGNLLLAEKYFACLFGLNGSFYVGNDAIQYFSEYKFLLLIGIICCTQLPQKARNAFNKDYRRVHIYNVANPTFYLFLFIVSTSYLVMGAYNPFIYFNF